MENEWDSSNFGMEFHYEEQQMASCFFNPVDQVDPFESALSSIVSSPARGEIQNDGIVLRELIGKLGSICNAGEISPQSPPKLNVSATEMNQSLSSFLIQGNSSSNLPAFSPFSADPGFIERAARSSCFGNGNIKGLSGEFRLNETELRCRSAARVGCGKLSRVSSKQSLKSGGSQIGAYESKVALSRSATPENGEFGDSKEVSSVSEQISADANPRKRKSTSRGMAKDAILFPLVKKAKATTKIDEMNTKSNSADEAIGTHKGNFEEQLESNVNQKETSKPPEPPTDYIHVRARRGQATDSHSLAERVRREKISERMKFLQDLVPGCNKVTGKAVMLDEIINYVQSLQRQVEFLSMKLAFLNPNMEVEALLSKDISQSHVALPQNILPLDSPASGLSFGFESQWPIQQGVTPNELENIFSAYSLDTTLHRNSGTQSPPTNALRQYASQPCSFWEYDLQSVAQTGFDENQTQSLRGSVEAIHMKIEL